MVFHVVDQTAIGGYVDLPVLATEAAALLAGYALAIGQDVADKTRTAISDRLFSLVKGKFARRTGDARALENLMQEPTNMRHREVVAAALTDALEEDPSFGDELRQVVTEVQHAYGYVGQSVTASGPVAGNQIASNFGPGASVSDSIVNNQGSIDQSVRTTHDQRRITHKRGAGVVWLIIGIAAGLIIAGTTTFVIINVNEPDERTAPPVVTSKKPRAEDVGGGRNDDSMLFETNPYKSAQQVYHHIARGDYAETACRYFAETARDEFASNLGHQTCEDAVAELVKQVTDKNDYASSMSSVRIEPITGDTVRISSCAGNFGDGIRGGPALGAFIVEKVPNSVHAQWIIAGHESEVC